MTIINSKSHDSIRNNRKRKRCFYRTTLSLHVQQQHSSTSTNDSTLILLCGQYGHSINNIFTVRVVMTLLVLIILQQQKMILSFPTDTLSMSMSTLLHPYSFEKNVGNGTMNEICIHTVFPTIYRRRNTNIRSIIVPCVYWNYIPNKSLLTLSSSLSSFDFYHDTSSRRNVTKQSIQQQNKVLFTLFHKYYTNNSNQQYLPLENERIVQTIQQNFNGNNACQQQYQKRNVDTTSTTILTILRGGSTAATDSDDNSDETEVDNDDTYIDKLLENVSDDDDDDSDDNDDDDDDKESDYSHTVNTKLIDTSPVAKVVVSSKTASSSSSSSSSSSKSISTHSPATKRSNIGSNKSSDTLKLPTGSSMSSKAIISSIKSKNSDKQVTKKRSTSSKAKKNTKTTNKVKNQSTTKKNISKKTITTKNINTTNNTIIVNNTHAEREDTHAEREDTAKQQQSSDAVSTKTQDRTSYLSQSQSTHYSSIQQQQQQQQQHQHQHQHQHEQQQVLPNAIYRFLLKRGGNIGRTMVLTLIMCTEWIQLYIPMIGSMGKKFIIRFFPPLKQPKRSSTSDRASKKQQQQRDKLSKKQRADQYGINQLQRLGNVQVEKYKQLSQKFIKRYGFGSSQSSSDDNNENNDDTMTKNKNKTKTSAELKSTESLFDKIATIATMPLKSSSSSGQTAQQQINEEEIDNDIEWVLQSLSRPISLNNKKGSKVVIPHTINDALTRLIVSHRRKEYNIPKDTSGLDSMNAFASDVSRFITNDIIGTSSDEKNNIKNNDDSFVSRSIRAATGTSASGLSRILLGAYPRDAVPPNEAGNAAGIYSIAYKYGWGEWIVSDNEDDDDDYDGDNTDYSFDNSNDDNNNDDDDNYYTYEQSNNHYMRNKDTDNNSNNENSENDRYNNRRPKGTVNSAKYQQQLPQVSKFNTVKKRKKVKKVKKIAKLDDTTANRRLIGRVNNNNVNTKQMTALGREDSGQKRRKKKVKKKSKGMFDILKDNVHVSFGDTTSKVQVGFSFGTSSSSSLSSHYVSPRDSFNRHPTESTTRTTRTESLYKRSPILDRQRPQTSSSTSTSSLSKEYDERKHIVAKQLKSRAVSKHRSILDDDID